MTAFNITVALENLLRGVGLTSDGVGGEVVFEGADPILPARHRLGAAVSIAMMANAVAVATIWRQRKGVGQDLHVDLRRAIHQVNPHSRWHPTVGGQPYPRKFLRSDMFTFEPYRTRDDRWIMAVGGYPHLKDGWLRFLGVPPDRARVTAELATWQSFELEAAAAEAGLVATVARTPEEWAHHEHGSRFEASAPIEVRRIGDGDARPLPSGPRPLAGLRVLSFTHAIAGPTVGRSLAEQGADVLNVTFPDHFEHDSVYLEANVGSRSTYIDLRDDGARAEVAKLLRETDVVVDNHRPGKLSRFGLAPEQLAADYPGIIVATISAFGREGPWASRGGFDMNGSAVSGLMALEGGDGPPTLPPTVLINDHITGYLAALGVLAAVIRRSVEGGSWIVGATLAGNAMWCSSLGLVDPNAASCDEEHTILPPNDVHLDTPYGSVHRLAPQVSFSATPGHWTGRALVPRGSDRAVWLPR